jgi:hypothetical protein
MRFCLPIFLWMSAAPIWAQTQNPTEFFEKKIRPVLVNNCQACHNPKLKTAGLDLTSAEGFAHGGQSGPIVVEGNPEASRLIKVVGYGETLKMPPAAKLKEDEIADLSAWVKMGAVWPGVAAVTAPAQPSSRQSREFTAAEKSFWAFQPVKDPALPSVRDQSWVQTPVDRFVLAKLEEKGLKPAAPADKITLLRRATFDLTGLPPTEKETRAFLADPSKDAFRKVVERLLASPRYGERWGRHWLDVARYADSTGNDEDHRYPYAWRYRDYVIDAFNRDLPYNQFVREQLAGDLLPSPDGRPVNARGIVATGLLALGPKALAQKDKIKMMYDIYDEQVDVVSKAFLGITVACARCHDHKFDPILTKDYYSMIAIFANTRDFGAVDGVSKMLFRPLAPQAEYERYKAYERKVGQAELAVQDLTDRERDSYTKQLSPKLADYMIAAQRVYQGGAKLADVAIEKSLKEDVLRKWVEYLKPTPESRPHLNEWRSAPADKLSEVARIYQTRFEERAAKWERTMSAYRARSRKMLTERNMPPPERPEFEAATDPFFFDVYFGSGPLAIPQAQEDQVFPAEARRELITLRKELAELKSAAPPEPAMACAVEEGDPVNQKVFIRGDYNSPGEDAPKGFPKILTVSATQPEVESGSGRGRLADWLARPDHPLTARVMVNRIWQWHFGEGIVRTPDNFGKMGERPTHPELLDYLATRFVESGWSIKAMQRTIMLSSAYRMASQTGDAVVEADPENRLFSRFNRQRLDVEEIHDGMLAIDGTIDLTMGGTLQKGFGTDKENSADRLSLNPEKLRRRTVYLPLRRANLPTLLNLFDFGDATTVTGKRALTNVAPQALFMMNSDFVNERALNLAQSLSKREAEPARRMESAYWSILDRQPSAGEVDAGLTYIDNFRKKFQRVSELDAWQSFCRILLASDDFIYVD